MAKIVNTHQILCSQAKFKCLLQVNTPVLQKPTSYSLIFSSVILAKAGTDLLLLLSFQAYLADWKVHYCSSQTTSPQKKIRKRAVAR